MLYYNPMEPRSIIVVKTPREIAFWVSAHLVFNPCPVLSVSPLCLVMLFACNQGTQPLINERNIAKSYLLLWYLAFNALGFVKPTWP